ncbi:hypothetical protein J437_LFUL009869 [Ladona fulva]|uniref:Uncharacterized protein n=1 Tax=Ladona fulva TaxID=123851 RepID=A0A8K0KA15_LADFU|nr:hypothetical protein J437_LFUL009869 [Ladona fulva]
MKQMSRVDSLLVAFRNLSIMKSVRQQCDERKENKSISSRVCFGYREEMGRMKSPDCVTTGAFIIAALNADICIFLEFADTETTMGDGMNHHHHRNGHLHQNGVSNLGYVHHPETIVSGDGSPPDDGGPPSTISGTVANRSLQTQLSTVWNRRQHAVCVRSAYKHYGSKKNPNVVLSNLNMTVAKGTM